MPELPEVETVKRVLEQLVINKTIATIDVYYPGIIKGIGSESFVTQLSGQTIKSLKRRGKFLIVQFSKIELVSHLRMEGKYNYYEVGTFKKEKHDHIVFNFTDGSVLCYNDTRKFGTMELIDRMAEKELLSLQKLGIEGISEQLTGEYLYPKFQLKRKVIKDILLDQTIIAGIGNIYASEILFQAKINPQKITQTLTKKECQDIAKYTRKVLESAVSMGGTTIKSFSVSGNVSGLFQQELAVYARSGLPCIQCQSVIEKKMISNRGTYFCPRCQC